MFIFDLSTTNTQVLQSLPKRTTNKLNKLRVNSPTLFKRRNHDQLSQFVQAVNLYPNAYLGIRKAPTLIVRRGVRKRSINLATVSHNHYASFGPGRWYVCQKIYGETRRRGRINRIYLIISTIQSKVLSDFTT